MGNSASSGNILGYASGTQPGLVSTTAQTFAGKKTLDGGALIAGDTSGNAISSGYVGQFGDGIESTLTSFASTGAWKQVFAVTLGAGIYDLQAFAFLDLNGATVTGFALCINTTTASATGLTFPRYYSIGSNTQNSETYTSRNIAISASTTYYINVQADYTVATPRFRAYYKWYRIG